MKRRRLALLALCSGVLAADLAKPGWGQFPNPIFYGKVTINGLKDRFAETDVVDPSDARLEVCANVDGAVMTISEAQAMTRKTLAGKTSSFAVSELGTPACELANGGYRWLTETGLALDLEINEEGQIEDAQLNR